MAKKTITTAAFLAGATTLAVSLPVMAAEKRFDLSGFDGVAVTSGLSAEVQVGNDFAITATARNNRTLERLNLHVRNGTLIVERSGSWTDYSIFAARRDATIYITLPELKSIEADAGSDVFVQGAKGDELRANVSAGADLGFDSIDVGSLQFNVSSGSDLDAAGTCESLVAQASSGANIDAEDLICDTVDARASSGGNIDVTAGKTAIAHASSGADVDIHGSPESVEKRESSGGDVGVDQD